MLEFSYEDFKDFIKSSCAWCDNPIKTSNTWLYYCTYGNMCLDCNKRINVNLMDKKEKKKLRNIQNSIDEIFYKRQYDRKTNQL